MCIQLQHALSTPTFIAHFIPKDVVLLGQPMRRDFHIIATYKNTYNAAMYNSNNTVIITQFLSSNLSHMIK